MIRRAPLAFLAVACATSSCVYYDAALLDEARGGESGGDGDDSVPTGGTASGGADGGGSGGENLGAGGESGGNTGGVASGGTGGADGAGGEGTGGGECTEPSGARGPLLNVGETSTIETFNQAWANIGTGSPYTGSWFVAVDANGSGISNKIQDAYERDPCSSPGDTSLHVVGEGYTVWGASFDANLMFNVAELDASEFAGVTFWARSDESNLLRLGFSDGDAENGAMPIESTPLFIQATWTQHWVAFPEDVAKGQLTVIHIVAVAAETFDFWLDDLTFYAEP
jgi:hypothetical protein